MSSGALRCLGWEKNADKLDLGLLLDLVFVTLPSWVVSAPVHQNQNSIVLEVAVAPVTDDAEISKLLDVKFCFISALS